MTRREIGEGDTWRFPRSTVEIRNVPFSYFLVYCRSIASSSHVRHRDHGQMSALPGATQAPGQDHSLIVDSDPSESHRTIARPRQHAVANAVTVFQMHIVALGRDRGDRTRGHRVGSAVPDQSPDPGGGRVASPEVQVAAHEARVDAFASERSEGPPQRFVRRIRVV
ncbi:MAG: hypothetical protein ABEI52_05630, partial [Halobacteriaceae archaeon]